MAVREDARNLGRFRLPKGITITVGVHSEEGEAEAQRAANDTGAPLTVSDIATFHEYGTSRCPQRSFIRGWFDENQDFILKTLRGQMSLAASGKITSEMAAERCALAFEGGVKQRISRGIPPPNAPVTIERKGSSTPLIDTGQLRNAIRSRVEVK